MTAHAQQLQDQLELAHRLIGKTVIWAHDVGRQRGLFGGPVPTMVVEAVNERTGLVLISDHPGEFSPTLFVEVV